MKANSNIITNATKQDILILVNKKHPLKADYVPKPLIIPNVNFIFKYPDEKQYMQTKAARALEKLFHAAKNEYVFLYAVSGYRSYARQVSIYNRHVETIGQIQADRVSAKPGHSEHQTGLAMDVTSENVNFTLSQEFADTREGKWLAKNAHKYGFIIRYPRDKELSTGYSYEPWHLRYVGTNAAGEIFKDNLILEDYIIKHSKK